LIGLNALNVRGGAILGLTLSGIILTFLDWRALFYINIPIGIFGTYWARKQLKETLVFKERQPMDWIGFGTFTVAMATLLFSLTYAAYGFSTSIITLSLGLVSIASFAFFVIQERRAEFPMLDLGLFRLRQFSGGSLAILFNAIAWGAVLVLLSLYLQLVRGLSPLEAGITLIPFELATVLVGAPSGRLSDTYGRRPFMLTGLTFQGVAVYLFSTLTISASISLVTLYMIMFGVGTGLFNSPVISSIMESVPSDRRGIASATTSAFFSVGYIMSISLAVVIMTTVVPYHTISTMIASASPTAATQANKLLFASGLRRAYLLLSLLNFVAIIPATLRGGVSSLAAGYVRTKPSVSVAGPDAAYILRPGNAQEIGNS
jgi:MFS family permease